MFNESKRSNNKLFPFVFSTSKVQTPPFMSVTSVRGNEFRFITLPPATGVPSGLALLVLSQWPRFTILLPYRNWADKRWKSLQVMRRHLEAAASR